MDADSPASWTAYGAARHRAVHQIVEDGVILRDPLAVPLLGESPDELRATADEGGGARMRWFICARSRYAEAVLAAAVPAGLDQLVVLGAGLETFGYRNTHDSLHVVELDHPATQEWKLRRLAGAGIEIPACVTHQPVDFERDDLSEVLSRSIDGNRPVLFWWLGVTPYLTVGAVEQTLTTLGELPHSAVVLDHVTPMTGDESPEVAAWVARRRERVASLGEPWISEFEPQALAELLHRCGFHDVHLEDAAASIRRLLGLPPSPAPHRTRLALGARGWPVAAQAARS